MIVHYFFSLMCGIRLFCIGSKVLYRDILMCAVMTHMKMQTFTRRLDDYHG